MATQTKAVAPRVLVPKGAFVGGEFVGHYEAVTRAARDDGLPRDVRVLDVTVLRGHVRELRPVPAPNVNGTPVPIHQARLSVLADGAPQEG